MIDQKEIAISLELQQVINADMAWSYGIIPAAIDTHDIQFYVSKETDLDLIRDDLEMLMGKSVDFIVLDHVIFRKNLGKYYRRSGNNTGNKVATHQGDKDDSILQVIHVARRIGSSDIHIEIYEDVARVRIRIDGH
jgi:type II secretory ATPase GspE/PulE/Tfp pilus assembly ATPase PilB-like protein